VSSLYSQPITPKRIGAVVLAAGQSRRMGQPKLVLPWGQTTVIARVAEVLLEAGLAEVIVVTGGSYTDVETALQHLPVQTIFNPQYTGNDMLRSLQVGLGKHHENIQATLVALGDQPQIEVDTVRALAEAYQETGSPLIIPSFNNRRGHPWLVSRTIWPNVFALDAPATLRDFLNQHRDQIHYLTVTTPSILKDLDTPADYDRERPDFTG
jgi:molybdenum cofactor cytidylyltransferase